MDKPWNDVADQQRPVEPDAGEPIVDEEAAVGVDPSGHEPLDTLEADPADIADQRREVPLPEIDRFE